MVGQLWRISGFFTVLFLMTTVASAQEDSIVSSDKEVDILYFKDGSVLKGKVQSFSNDTLKIRIAGGQSLSIARDQIERIEMSVSPDKDPRRREGAPDTEGEEKKKERAPDKEEEKEKKKGKAQEKEEEKDGSDTSSVEPAQEKSSKTDTSKKKEEGPEYFRYEEAEEAKSESSGDPLENSKYYRHGYQHHLAHGWFINAGDGQGMAFLLNPHVYSIHTHRFTPHFAAGIYAGVQVLSLQNRSYPPFNSLGVTANGDLFEDSPLTPFWDLQAGFSHAPPVNNNPYGFFMNLGVGGKLFFNNTKGMSILVGYQYYNLKQEFGNNGPNRRGNFTRRDIIRGMSLRITMHL